MGFFAYRTLSLKKKVQVNAIMELLSLQVIVEFSDLIKYLAEKNLKFDYDTIKKLAHNGYFDIVKNQNTKFLVFGDESEALYRFYKKEYLQKAIFFAKEEYNKILTLQKAIGTLNFQLFSPEIATHKKNIYFFSKEKLDGLDALEDYSLIKLTCEDILTDEAKLTEQYELY